MATRKCRPARDTRNPRLSKRQQKLEAEAWSELHGIDAVVSATRIRMPPERWQVRLVVDVQGDAILNEWRLWAAAAMTIMKALDDTNGLTGPRPS
jgi:hypothetical protein